MLNQMTDYYSLSDAITAVEQIKINSLAIN